MVQNTLSLLVRSYFKCKINIILDIHLFFSCRYHPSLAKLLSLQLSIHYFYQLWNCICCPKEIVYSQLVSLNKPTSPKRLYNILVFPF